MSLIEGIGDEVTILVAVLFVLVLIVVAWMSTHVDAIPYTSIVIIDRERFSELLRRLRGTPSPENDQITETSDTTSGEPSLVGGQPSDASTPETTSVVSEHHRRNSLPPSDSAVESLALEEHEVHPETVGISDSGSADPSVSQPASEVLLPTSEGNAEWTDLNGAGGTDQVEIKLQYIDGRQKTVMASPDDTIGHFKRFVLTGLSSLHSLCDQFCHMHCIVACTSHLCGLSQCQKNISA